MSWYKKAQQMPETPEWSFPEAEHDYNPSWDYEIDPIPDSSLVQISEQVLQEINSVVIPEIGMGKSKAAYIKSEGQDLAKYVYGTAPYPVFVINLELIKKESDSIGGNVGHEIAMTLFHELGHAIQDWMEIDLDESEAEDFATDYVIYKQLYNFWE